jgi:hypothetical protein
VCHTFLCHMAWRRSAADVPGRLLLSAEHPLLCRLAPRRPKAEEISSCHENDISNKWKITHMDLSIINPLLMLPYVTICCHCQQVHFHEKSPPSSSGPWLVQPLVQTEVWLPGRCQPICQARPAVGTKPTSGASQRAGKEGRILLENPRMLL